MQYYSRQIRVNLADLMRQTKQFVLQVEELVDGLNAEKVATLQQRLKELG